MTVALPIHTPDPTGLTLSQFALAAGLAPERATQNYRRMLLDPPTTGLPAITRIDESDGGIKFSLPAGTATDSSFHTESVIIPMRSFHGHRWHTLCLSSQVGCRMACTFCQTGRMGLLRNLTPSEIVVQLMVARRLLQERHATSRADTPADIRNLVFMGMGEPLDNFDAVVQAIGVFTDSAGFNFPRSRITVSTVGRIDGIKKLAALNWPHLHLAISLNAPNDELRNRLMPVNRAMPLHDLQRALLDYPLPRRGRFLIEYVLIKNINDQPLHARQIAEWCRPLPVTVNVIPYNPQQPAQYESPDETAILGFVAQLRTLGVFAKRRITHGRDLMGACGQLGNAKPQPE